jgi:hypothetical protein
MGKTRLPRVTDHCLVRFCERVEGYLMEDLRRQIAELCAPVVAAGATALKIDGGQFQFEDGVVVTFRPTDSAGHLSKTGRERLSPKKVTA